MGALEVHEVLVAAEHLLLAWLALLLGTVGTE
jgi:hypothetical protein